MADHNKSDVLHQTRLGRLMRLLQELEQRKMVAWDGYWQQCTALVPLTMLHKMINVLNSTNILSIWAGGQGTPCQYWAGVDKKRSIMIIMAAVLVGNLILVLDGYCWRERDKQKNVCQCNVFSQRGLNWVCSALQSSISRKSFWVGGLGESTCPYGTLEGKLLLSALFSSTIPPIFSH